MTVLLLWSLRYAMRSLQRDVAVLLPDLRYLLVAQHAQRAGDAPPRGMRPDHVIDIAAARGDKRIEETVLVFLGARGDLLLVADVLPENNLDRAFRPHHR